MPPSKTGTRFLSKFQLVVFSVVFAAFLSELGLRIGGYTYPEFYQPDSVRGYALRPGVRGWYRKEGQSYVTINSDGLRDRDHAKSKRPNTIRIAVLGDSFAEALQVPVEDAFWSIMNNRLQQCAATNGQTIEVINFGVSGYGTAQELLTLQNNLWDYAPDLVVLTVTTNNDITDNSRALKKTNEVPYFIHRDGQLVEDDTFKTDRSFLWRQSRWAAVGRWFRDNLRLVQAFIEALRGVKTLLASRSTPSTTAANTKSDGDQFASSVELGIDNFIYLEPRDPTWNEAWAVTEDLLTLMNN
ncbi:MAG: SGNH/GDSL hydrolase family protein, partial [Pyrinomonadaceae bacterium]